jgi:hypothetical protein
MTNEERARHWSGKEAAHWLVQVTPHRAPLGSRAWLGMARRPGLGAASMPWQ